MRFFLVGLLGPTSDSEAPIGDFSTWTFNENWTITGDIIQDNVTLPTGYKNSDQVSFVLHNTLPSYVNDGMNLTYVTALQNARVYIDDELRCEYHSDNFSYLKDPIPSAYTIVELHKEDAGKQIRIELSTDGRITLNEVSIGYGNNVWFKSISQHLFVAIAAIILICGGLISMLFYFTFGPIIHSTKTILYLGQANIAIGLWFLSESGIRQLIFKQPSYSAIFAYILCEITGGFIALYFNEIQKDMCDIIEENIKYNGFKRRSKVFNCNLKDLKLSDFNKPVDVVICNPPYFKVNAKNKINEKKEIAISRHEIEATLEDIIQKHWLAIGIL